jgi:hypothetical protein
VCEQIRWVFVLLILVRPQARNSMSHSCAAVLSVLYLLLVRKKIFVIVVRAEGCIFRPRHSSVQGKAALAEDS